MTEITLEKKYYSGEAVVQMLLENGMGLAGPKLTKVLLERLAELPAADVREIRNGEWKHRKAKNVLTGEIRNVIECSVCGSVYSQSDQDDENYIHDGDPNFCPNCGADMRGGNR